MIKVARTIQERFEDKYRESEGCWEWIAGKLPNGYGQFWIAGREQLAHRVAYGLYVNEIPAGLCVCHRCDNPGCVNPAHLFLGTLADNSRDRENKGRGADRSGEKSGTAKLTKEQVVEIRTMYSEGATQNDIAKEFGVSRPTISHIVCRLAWSKI